ncbi:MAG: hypothetical protein ACLU80_16450 [Dorea sp.]
MKILICIIALLGYLQYGREEQAVNTMVSTSDTFYKQEFDVIANKLFNLDKEKYAEELIAKAVENKYRNVRFSYDITGYPNEIVISVYSNEWSYEHNQRMYQIIYSSDKTVIMLKTMLINLRFKYTKNDLDFHMTYLSFNDTIVTEN